MSARRAAADQSRRALAAEIDRVLALIASPPAQEDASGASNGQASRPLPTPRAETPRTGTRASIALAGLVEAFRLSPFERDLLLLCVAAEIDARTAELCAGLQGRAYPTFALALAVLCDPHWSALAPSGPLRHWQLIDLAADGAALIDRRLRADERIVHHLTGIDYLDPRLAPVVRPAADGARPAPAMAPLAQELRALLHSGPVVLAGDDAPAKRALTRAFATDTGRALFSLSSEDIPAAAAERALFARLWEREAALTGALLLVGCDESPASAAAFAEEVRAPLMLACRETPPGLDRKHGRIVVDRPRWRVPDAPVPSAASVPLGELAQRIDARATWDDIVLPAHHLQTLREIGLHLRHADRVFGEWGLATKSARGLGISALFAGPSGTGKTMAAEVLANDVGRELYRVDLSTVVSKYVGETEKNLRRVFDAAEDAGVILLFDEADALFGKRSEVRDSHDRYANIEVSYLLQRMESFAGLAILTTNMKQALDPAFLRRLRFVVQFPFPDARQRAEIWERTFPPALPRRAIDVERLSQLNVAGGSIRNIALNASFFAAADGGALTMQHLLQAAHGEYAKLEKPLGEAETRGWT
ncbi:MAG: ATP-binding protein [Chloroflexi bacterium]|nr:ATP-binding protein [Chloroflexota bacterium]